MALRIDPDLLLSLSAASTGSTQNLVQLASKQLDGTNKLIKAMGRTSSGSAIHGVDLYALVMALSQPKNKLLVLQLLRRSELIELMHLMEKPQLLQGLMFFSKEKLLQLLTLLGKELLVKLLLRLIPMDNLIKKLPLKEILRIFRSEKITNRWMIKAFAMMDKGQLAHLVSLITGKPADKMDMRAMLKLLFNTPKHQLLEAFKSLPFKTLTPLVVFFLKQDKELLQNLSNTFIFRQFENTSKPNLIQAMDVFPNELLIQFLSLLPDKLLTLVVSQIDDKVLMAYLLSEKQNLLQSIVSGGLQAAV